MNTISLLDWLLLAATLTLDLIIPTLVNSYWLINKIYWSFTINTIIFPLTFFWRITPHVFSIDKNTYSSSLSISYKLTLILSDKLYQHDGSSNFSIDVIIEDKVLLTHVKEYVSSTTCSEMLYLNKFVRTIGWHLVTVISLGNNELLKIKCRSITLTILFHIDMKRTTTRRDDEVTALKR